MAKPGSVFIAVGAGHLAGQQSVIEQLKALLKADRDRESPIMSGCSDSP